MPLPTQSQIPSYDTLKKSSYRQLLLINQEYEGYLQEINIELKQKKHVITTEFEQAFALYVRQLNTTTYPLITNRFQQGILCAVATATSHVRLVGALHFQLQELVKEEAQCGIIGSKRLSSQLLCVQHAAYVAISDFPIDKRWKMHDDLTKRWQALNCRFDSKRQQQVEELCQIMLTVRVKLDAIVAIKTAINTLRSVISKKWLSTIFYDDNKRLADMLFCFLTENEAEDDPVANHFITYEQAHNVLQLIKQQLAFLQNHFKRQAAIFHANLQLQFNRKPFALVEAALQKMNLLVNNSLLATLQASWLELQKTLPEEEQYQIDLLKAHYNQRLMNIFFMINLASSPAEGLPQQRDGFRLAAAIVRQLQGLWSNHLLPAQPMETQRLSIFKVVQIWLENYWHSARLPIGATRLLSSTQLLTYLADPHANLESVKRQLFYTLFDVMDAQNQNSFSSKTILFKRKSRLMIALQHAIRQLEAEHLLSDTPLIEAFVREHMQLYWQNTWFFADSWEQHYVMQLLQAIRQIEQMNDENCQQLHNKLIAYQQGFYGALSAGDGEQALQWMKDYTLSCQQHLLEKGHVNLMKRQLIAALFTECLKQLQADNTVTTQSTLLFRGNKRQRLYNHLQFIHTKLIDTGRLEASYSKEVLPRLIEGIHTIITNYQRTKPTLRLGQLQTWLFNDFCQEDIKLLYELQQQCISAQTAGEASSLLDAVIGRLANSPRQSTQQVAFQLQELLTSLQTQRLLPASQPITADGNDLQQIAQARRNYEAALQGLIPRVAMVGR